MIPGQNTPGMTFNANTNSGYQNAPGDAFYATQHGLTALIMLRDDLQFLETREQAIQQGQVPESLWNLPSIASWSAGLGGAGGGSLNVVQGFLLAPLNYVKQAWFFRVDVVNLGIHWSAERPHNLGWTDSYDFNYRSSLLKGSEEASKNGESGWYWFKAGVEMIPILGQVIGLGGSFDQAVRTGEWEDYQKQTGDFAFGPSPELSWKRRGGGEEGPSRGEAGGSKAGCPLRRAVSRLEAGRLEVSPFKEYYLKNLPLLPSRSCQG